MRPNWFIGLVVAELPGLENILADCPAELRRFHQTDLHITVAFLGPVEPEQAWRAWDGLGVIDSGPITISLGSLKPFGHRGSTFSFELDDGCDAVRELVAAKQNSLRFVAGLTPESRSPRPHITIARLKRKASVQARTAARNWAQTVMVPGEPLRLTKLALYTWAQDRRQQLFAVVAEHEFG